MQTNDLQLENLKIKVIRKKVKHCYLGVYPPNGEIRVTCSPRYSERDILLFITKKYRWIETQLKKVQSENKQIPKDYLSGETVHYLGEKYFLKIIESYKQRLEYDFENKQLILYVKDPDNISKKQKILTGWYRDQLKILVPPMITKWSLFLDVSLSSWTVRKMKRRWGTCFTATKHMVLSESLARYPIDCIEYVVVHELIHLKVPNHGPRFKAKISKALPNWKLLKRKLEEM